MAELVVLGSGTGIPTRRRSPPGLLLNTDGGGAVLIDPGPGTLSRMVHHGVSVEDVIAVLLTHHHPDHTLDLMALLFARRNPSLRSRLRKLRLAGPPGTESLYERMKGLYGRWVEAEEGLQELVETDEGPLPSGLPVAGEAFRLKHVEPSLGYRLRLGDFTLAVTGDTGPCENLVPLGREADLFLLECALPDSRAEDNHMTPSSAGRAAARAKPARLVLYHLYPEVDGPSALRTVQGLFPGPAVVAEDGDCFSLIGKK